MRVVLQRVRRAGVVVGEEPVAAIDRGVLLLVGVEKGDGEADAEAIARKVAALRLFPGRTPMDLPLAAVGGEVLVVSQFTLLGTLSGGNRPGFDRAEAPARAEALYRHLAAALADAGLVVRTGRFGAAMAVDLVNDGPVTFLLEARGGTLLG